MEHQYIKPKGDQVEDFLDIASLFIASTDHYASNFIINVDYINEDNRAFEEYSEINIIYDNEKAIMKIETHDIKFEVKKGDAEYLILLKTHLKKMEFR